MGLSDSAPYMHDGSAETVEDEILSHAGEAQKSRDRFTELPQDARAKLLEFLSSL